MTDSTQAATAGISVRDLEWLLALAEEEHVTEAAWRLGVSQPTLSRALARVEQSLGTTLFHRHSGGITTTQAGLMVVAAAQEICDRHRQLRDDLATLLSPDTGVVRLAFLDSMATSLVPQLLGAFHRAAPGIRVTLSQGPAHEIEAGLRDASVDLGITSERRSEFGWQPLHQERLVVAVPPGHRLATRKRVKVGELAHEPMIVTPEGFGHRRMVEEMLRDADVVPLISFESQDMATMEGLVAAGLGVAIVTEAVAGVSGTVGVPMANKAAQRTIGLIWRLEPDLSPPATRLRDFIREMH